MLNNVVGQAVDTATQFATAETRNARLQQDVASVAEEVSEGFSTLANDGAELLTDQAQVYST